MKHKIILIIMLLFIASAQAKIEFYTGPIQIDSLNAKITVGDKANVELEYILINAEDKENNVNLKFENIPPEAISNQQSLFTFNSGETKIIKFNYSINIEGDSLKLLKFEPSVLFDGLPNSQPVKNYNVEIILPENVNELLYSSEEYTNVEKENTRTIYKWSNKNHYPVPLIVQWSKETANIDVKREMPSVITKIPQIIQINITLTNKGSAALNDILLEDIFLSQFFERVEPLDEFTLIEPGEDQGPTDRLLIWNKEIGSLNPGETKNFNYKIKVINFDGENKIEPLKVFVSDSLVKISEENIILMNLCGNNFCDYNENNQNCPQDCLQGSADNFCDGIEDEICDADCSKEEDIDCQEISFSSLLGNKILIGLIVIIVLTISFILYKLKKSKWKEN